MTPDKHIRVLDTLRGVAALGVFTSHYIQHFFHPEEMGWTGRVLVLLGVWAVGAFFVLSGFVIHGGTLRGRPVEWADYGRRRFCRIVPAYIGALIVCSAAGQYGGVPEMRPANLADFVTHFLFVSSFFPDYFEHISGVFWTLIVECYFYLFYPLLRPLLMRIGAMRFTFLSILAGGALWVGLSAAVSPGQTRNMMQHLPFVLFWKWALGVLLAEMFYRGTWPALRSVLSCRAVLPLALIGAFLGTALPPGALELNYSRFILPFFSFALVGALLFSPAGRFRTRAGEHLGDISYSIYLWHPLALAAVLQFLRGPPLLALPVALAGSLLLAEASHRLIERPFQAWARRPSSG